MNILVACEMSGRVREAFRKRGHNAWSCDLLPAMDGGIYHIQADVLEVLAETPGKRPWDMLIAFPPCTHLASSGARHFASKRADGRQQAAIDFVMALWRSGIKRVCIENPVGILSGWDNLGHPTQIIQPWQFGHPESKKTCLWLRNLPPLGMTNILPPPRSGRWNNQTPSGQNKLGPSPDRAMLRSLTYQGIAEAMADQWGRE